MPFASAISYNPISATCTLADSCLYQVAGYANSNPVEQIFGCQAMFGLPVITTVTLPSDPYLSTAVDTSTYTDIIITTSTVYSTLEETSTSFETISETVTAYTTTVVNTLTTTVPAPTIVKRKTKKRRGCQPRPSTSSTAFLSTTSTPSSAPSSASSSTVSSTTSSSPLFPLATECPSREEYSSACACLAPTAVTEYAPAITSIVHETESSTVESTTKTIITLAVTTVIVQPATTRLTSTLTTLTSSTTTAVQTSTPSPVVPQTFGIVISDGPNAGKPAITSGSVGAPAYAYAWASSGTPTQIGLTSAGTTPFLAGNPGYRMYVRLSTTSYGIVFFTTPAYVASSAYTWVQPSCSLNPTTLVMSCTTPNNLTRFLQCGANFYMANSATTPGGCIEVHLKAV